MKKNTNIEKIDLDPYSQRIFSIFETVFLVGGYIRDALLNRTAVDRDYVVNGDPLRAAQKAQKIFPGKIIQFRDNLTIRIALKNGGNIDFTRLLGSIEEDLVKRDFTINSMAYHKREGLIDPYGGSRDLRSRYIRVTRSKNFIHDPIRMLRAFRFESELGYEIDRDTLRVINQNCGLIYQTCVERVTSEIIKLMNGEAFIKALRRAQKSGILKHILLCNNNKISVNINNMVQINGFIRSSPYRKMLGEEVSHGLNKRSMILLTALLHNINTSSTLLSINNKCIDFKRNIEKYSKLRRKGVISGIQLFELFKSMKDHHIEFGLYAMDRDLLRKIRKYIQIKENSLLDGHEVASITGLSGEQLGHAMRMLEGQRYIGKIRNKREALVFVKSIGS